MVISGVSANRYFLARELVSGEAVALDDENISLAPSLGEAVRTSGFDLRLLIEVRPTAVA